MNTDSKSSPLIPRILMVCPEYPPMQGGLGRYTCNLTTELRKIGFDVQVICNKLGHGDFSGLSPSHADDSNVLLQLVDKVKPDIVHIQYEQGMYGYVLDGLDPRKTRTNIDSFYDQCKVTDRNHIPFCVHYKAVVKFGCPVETSIQIEPFGEVFK